MTDISSILAPADLPELFLALPPTFTFPLARLVADYSGANNGFNIAMWRLDGGFYPPHWMAECFHDWASVVFPAIPIGSRPMTPLISNLETSQNKHGLISVFSGLPRPTSPEWVVALKTFIREKYVLISAALGATHDSYIYGRMYGRILKLVCC